MKETSNSEAVNLNGMITYQRGSVVSRTLIKKQTGTVTLFAFDQGQALSEHTTPFDAIAHIIDGEAEITVSGKVSHVKAGEIILMPANEPHALKAVKKYKMLFIMIKS